MDAINKALSLKAELDALRPISQEQEARVMQKLRLDWNYNSNHLEGNSLTFGETKALILFGLTAQGKPLKDHVEITGHNEAIKWVEEVVKQEQPLTESFIRQLHVLLLKEPYEVDAITPDGNPTHRRIAIGMYKTVPNHVLTSQGEVFRFATPEETPARMNDLMEWLRKQNSDAGVNPVLLAAEFHYRFIRIHPFDDGNGRTARILMNFILMQHGFPPAIIKTDDKDEYFRVLRQADAGIFEPFAAYIASNVCRSLEIMIAGAKGEEIEEPEDMYKELALLKQRVRSIGKKAVKARSAEVLQELWENNLREVKNKIVKEISKISDLYKNTIINYYGVSCEITKNDNEDCIPLFHDDTSEIRIAYNFVSFNQIGFNEFSFGRSISFTFNEFIYKVTYAGGNQSISKPYDELISEKELHNLLKYEIDGHIKYIDNIINKMQEK